MQKTDWPSSKIQHDLKIDPEQFQSLKDGTKRHEVRDCSDRAFTIGDLLCLREFDRSTQEYTGQFAYFAVSNITSGGTYGLPSNICVMSVILSSVD